MKAAVTTNNNKITIRITGGMLKVDGKPLDKMGYTEIKTAAGRAGIQTKGATLADLKKGLQQAATPKAGAKTADKQLTVTDGQMTVKQIMAADFKKHEKVMALHLWHNMTVQEIAKLVDISTANVRRSIWMHDSGAWAKKTGRTLRIKA